MDAGGRQGPGATPMRTPLRDELGLNDPGATPGGIVSMREERAREKAARAELREGLLSLPAPRMSTRSVLRHLGQAQPVLIDLGKWHSKRGTQACGALLCSETGMLDVS